MGSKKGGGARTPYEAPNTLNSAQDLRIIDAICEGEIAGFAHGDDAPFKSIFFDDTPVQNPDNSFNFKGVTGFFQAGTPDQSYLPTFDTTERTVSVGANVKRNTPIIRAISDSEINRLRVTVGVERNVQIQENGDSVAATTQLVVELINNSGVQAARNVDFTEKSSGAFYHDVVFDELPAAPFNLRVRRVTPDSQNDKTANNTFFASYVEMIDAKLSYPHTALAALKIDSDQFGNQIPRRNYLIKGKIVQVPSNYNPETREYSGSLWDGSFKMAWTNNPAWVFYDLLTNARYATLAHRLHPNDIDKWALYQVAKYCDELVPDGFGGQEPRFVCNAYITDQRQAGELLNDLASVFCGLAVWNGNQISVLQDKHTDPVAAYGNANVVNGRFDYASASLKSIHTAVHVQYADKHDGYRAKVEYVANNQAVERYGLNIKRVTAFGCDSRGQAVRFGNWILETELRQQHTITFSVGREGLKHLPYDVVSIADNDYAGAQISGRVVAVSGSQITLDRDVNNAVGAMLFYTDTVSGSLKSVKITRQINGKTVETESAINAPAESAWAMSGRVKPRLYRAMSVKENTNDGTYTITALRHDPEKYGTVDTSAIFDNAVNTLHNTVPELNNAAVSAENGGLRLSWDNLATDGEVLDYDIKVYQNNVLYRHFPNNPTAEISLDNLPDGDYRAEIRGRNARGVYSPVLIKTWQINYTINGLRANAKTFAIELVWTLPEILAVVANTEIWYGTTSSIQAARKLATLPTPQNGYTLTGVAVTDRFYFWARLVDVNGRAGTWTAPILGQADPNPTPIVAQIQGAITESALSRDLIQQLNDNDTAAENRAKADAAAQIQAEANVRADAIRAEIQARQAAINQAAQTAQANLNAKAAELTAKAADLGNKITAVENVNAQQAQAIQTVTAAQSNTAAALEAEKVARATAVQAEAAARETLAARLNNQKFGGTNLLYDCEFNRVQAWGVGFSRFEKSTLSNGRTLIKVIPNQGIANAVGVTHAAESQKTHIVQGETYTLSFWARASVSGSLNYLYLMRRDGSNRFLPAVALGTEWQRVSVTFQAVWTTEQAYVLIACHLRNGYPDDFWFEFHSVKLEYGNVASDWSPSPADVQAAIEAERTARATALQAETAAREALSARLATAESGIVAEREARTTADNAQTQQIQAAQSRLNAAESSIGNLQRTTAEQSRALTETQTTLTAKIDGLNVGGRNLLKNSDRPHESTAYATRYALTEAPAVGDDVVVTLWGAMGEDRTGIGVYNSAGFSEVARLRKIADGVYQGLGKWKKPMRNGEEVTPNDTHLNVYFYPNSATSTNIINKIKLEKGNLATDWTPAPEDVQAELTAYQSAQASKDEAQTAEIQAAKSQISQNKSTIEQMRTTKADKTEVVGLVRTTLQSEWRSDVQAAENRANAKITALENTVSNQNRAMATRLDSLTADFTRGTGTNLVQNSDFAADYEGWSMHNWQRADGTLTCGFNLTAGANGAYKYNLKDEKVFWVRDKRSSDSAYTQALAQNSRSRFAVKAGDLLQCSALIAGWGFNQVAVVYIDFYTSDGTWINHGSNRRIANEATPKILSQTLNGRQTTGDYTTLDRFHVCYSNCEVPPNAVWGQISIRFRFNPNSDSYGFFARPQVCVISSLDMGYIPYQVGVMGLSASVQATQAELTAHKTAQAAADQAQTSEINAAKSRIGTAEASIKTTQTTLTSLGGKVQSLYSLKVQAVGNRKAVAGLALGADGATGDSQMLVMADKFALVQPNTTTIKAPFVVTTVNGQAKMALAGDLVADGTILGKHIAASQTIQAPTINGGSLNIGNGRFTVSSQGQVSIRSEPSRNIGTQINSNGVYVYDEKGVQQVAIGLL